MKKSIPLIALSFLLALSFPGRAQDLISTLKQLRLPVADLDRFHFPFTGKAVAQKPTGTERRLFAYYMMEDHGNGFERMGDSARLYWPPFKGKGLKYAERYINPYVNRLNQPLDPAKDITYFKTDSIVRYRGSTNGVFDYLDTRTTATLNAVGYPISEIDFQYNHDSLAWQNYQRRDYTYDPGNRMVTATYGDWYAPGAWYTNFRDSFTYNAAGQITSRTRLTYNNTTALWTDIGKHTYTYDNNGNWVHYLARFWGSDSCDYTMTYNSENLRTSITVRIMGSGWQNSYREFYTYDTAGQMTHYLHEYWDWGAWQNQEQADYTYNADGQHTSIFFQLWDFGLGWRNDLLETYTYSGGNLSDIVVQQYNYPLTQWMNRSKLNVTHDSHDMITSIWSETWVPDNNGGGIWDTESSRKYLFSYQDYEDSEVAIREGSGRKNMPFTLYPNPASFEITVAVDGQLIDQVTLVDIQGKTVFTNKSKLHTGSLIIPTRQLAPGVYTVVVQSGQQSGSRMVSVRH